MHHLEQWNGRRRWSRGEHYPSIRFAWVFSNNQCFAWLFLPSSVHLSISPSYLIVLLHHLKPYLCESPSISVNLRCRLSRNFHPFTLERGERIKRKTKIHLQFPSSSCITSTARFTDNPARLLHSSFTFFSSSSLSSFSVSALLNLSCRTFQLWKREEWERGWSTFFSSSTVPVETQTLIIIIFGYFKHRKRFMFSKNGMTLGVRAASGLPLATAKEHKNIISRDKVREWFTLLFSWSCLSPSFCFWCFILPLLPVVVVRDTFWLILFPLCQVSKMMMMILENCSLFCYLRNGEESKKKNEREDSNRGWSTFCISFLHRKESWLKERELQARVGSRSFFQKERRRGWKKSWRGKRKRERKVVVTLSYIIFVFLCFFYQS